MLIPEDSWSRAAPASVLGEDVDLFKRFSAKIEIMDLLADECRFVVVHTVAGAQDIEIDSRGFSTKRGSVVIYQVVQHLVCRRPVRRLASLAVSH
jgi:hypothetical protein